MGPLVRRRPPEHVLLARTRAGSIAGTLLLEGPRADTVFTPMLGPAAGTSGCALI
jgi:hypothetical protein